MMSASHILDNFTCLDELVQVIYQSVHRFVVLSSISDTQWTLHVGLVEPEGRWWRGGWTESTILEIVGSKSSDKLLETFAEGLAETIIQGELYIQDWSPDKGVQIKLALGATSKKPMQISLEEMSSAEAAAYATGVFFDIALQAQARKCRLHASTNTAPTTLPSHAAPELVTARPVIPLPTHAADHGASGSRLEKSRKTPAEQTAQDEIKSLKAQLSDQNKRLAASVAVDPKVSTTAPRPLKGASLANPNKKARKFQAIEFESDED